MGMEKVAVCDTRPHQSNNDISRIAIVMAFKQSIRVSNNKDRSGEAFRFMAPRTLPAQELKQGIDLIIVTGVGKGQQFGEKVPKPGRAFRKTKRPALYDVRLCLHTHELNTIGERMKQDPGRPPMMPATSAHPE